MFLGDIRILQELYLGENVLQPSDGAYLYQLIVSNDTLQMLDLRNNQLQVSTVSITTRLLNQFIHSSRRNWNGWAIMILYLYTMRNEETFLHRMAAFGICVMLFETERRGRDLSYLPSFCGTTG